MNIFRVDDLALWRLPYMPPRYVAIVADEGDGLYRVRGLDRLEYLATADELDVVHVCEPTVPGSHT